MNMVIVVLAILTALSIAYHIINNYFSAQAHLADCKRHVMGLAAAVSKYSQDGLLGSLNGKMATDKQDVEADMQYIHNTCSDVLGQLNRDPTLLRQGFSFLSETIHSL